MKCVGIYQRCRSDLGTVREFTSDYRSLCHGGVLWSPLKLPEVPEWPIGTDCKSVGIFPTKVRILPSGPGTILRLALPFNLAVL